MMVSCGLAPFKVLLDLTDTNSGSINATQTILLALVTIAYSNWTKLAISRVVEAETVEEAIQQVRIHPIDLVIADAILPGKGGVSMCKNLKMMARKRSIKVLLISGESPSHITMKFGSDATLPKPFNSRSLSRALVAMTATHANKNCLDNKHQIARAV